MSTLVNYLWWFESKIMRHRPRWFCSWVWDMTLRWMPREEYEDRTA